MGYLVDGLQLQLSDGTEQLAASRGITVRRMSIVTEIYVDEATLKDCSDCQLTIMRMPQSIGNWKLTYGSKSLPYQLEGFWQQCLQFYPERNEWDTHGCLVTNSTNVHFIQCKCQAGPPITSTISGTLEMQLGELPMHKIIGKKVNWLALLFLVATTAAYALAVCWLCSDHDKHVVQRGLTERHIFALKTARSTARHLYLISVRTGPFFSAGTSAAVSVILHGEKGDSEVIRLADSCPALQRCSTVAFLAGTNTALGNLMSVEVWHDNSGEFPSWFLEDVTVVHCKTQGSWHFIFDEWFSVSSKDGRIEREAFASECSPPLQRTLKHSFIHALGEHHLWHSTVMMNSCSSLSRGQRILLCFSTVLSSGALSALRIYFTDVEPALTGLSRMYVVESGFVGLTVHLIHQVPTAIFRHYDCVALLQSVWTRFRMLVFCIFDAAFGRATRGHRTHSYSSAGYSFASNHSLDALYNMYRMQAQRAAAVVGGQPFHLAQVDNEDISCSLSSMDGSARPASRQSHQGESMPALSNEGSSDEQVTSGRLDPDIRNIKEEPLFRYSASPLEAALTNLAPFQRQYRRDDNSSIDAYLESAERSSSPSLGDSELSCLDFDTDDDEDSIDSGMAYKVPLTTKTRAGWLTWLLGSLGWLLVAGLVLGSVCTLVFCTEMFLAGANVLCFKMTAVAVLWSVFVVYPMQVCLVTACVNMHWHFSQKPQSALLMLPCSCNKILQRLLRRVRMPVAARLLPRRQCKRLRQHRSSKVASSKAQQRENCHIRVHGMVIAWVQRLSPGHLLHHLARYPSERKLVAMRNRCLAMTAFFKAMRYQMLPATAAIGTSPACTTSLSTNETVTTNTTNTCTTFTTTAIKFYFDKAASNTKTLSLCVIFIINIYIE